MSCNYGLTKYGGSSRYWHTVHDYNVENAWNLCSSWHGIMQDVRLCVRNCQCVVKVAIGIVVLIPCVRYSIPVSFVCEGQGVVKDCTTPW